MLIGSHLSIAGGLHKALEKAHGYGFGCAALFVRNQVQWKAARLSTEAIEKFTTTRRQLDIGPLVAHASYLINLAGLADIRRKSIVGLKEDYSRCELLDIEYLVFHPGSRKSVGKGIDLIAAALNQIAAESPIEGEYPQILLETTAGQGNGIGHTFEQLGAILAQLDEPERFGVCMDTCHIFAAGYDIRTPATYKRTMAEFDGAIGLDRLKAIHVNDSRRALGSRVDRHAHIGRGEIGAAAFANFVNDKRLANVPMILETPKGVDENGRDFDKINVAALRKLIRNR